MSIFKAITAMQQAPQAYHMFQPGDLDVDPQRQQGAGQMGGAPPSMPGTQAPGQPAIPGAAPAAAQGQMPQGTMDMIMKLFAGGL